MQVDILAACSLHATFLRASTLDCPASTPCMQVAWMLHTPDRPASTTDCPALMRVCFQLQAVNQFSLHNLCTSCHSNLRRNNNKFCYCQGRQTQHGNQKSSILHDDRYWYRNVEIKAKKYLRFI